MTDEATPAEVEEGEAQRGLESERPDAERDRAGLDDDDHGAEPEPLPDERRDER